MIYLTRVPAAPLSYFVELLWFYEDLETDHSKEKLLPDASMELIIDFSDGPKKLVVWAGLDVCQQLHAGRPQQEQHGQDIRPVVYIRAADVRQSGGVPSRFQNHCVVGRDGRLSGRLWLGDAGSRDDRTVRASVVEVCPDQRRLHDRLVQPHGSYSRGVALRAMDRSLLTLTRWRPGGAVSLPGNGRRSPPPAEFS